MQVYLSVMKDSVTFHKLKHISDTWNMNMSDIIWFFLRKTALIWCIVKAQGYWSSMHFSLNCFDFLWLRKATFSEVGECQGNLLKRLCLNIFGAVSVIFPEWSISKCFISGNLQVWRSQANNFVYHLAIRIYIYFLWWKGR